MVCGMSNKIQITGMLTPKYQNLTQVCGFLGICSVLYIFICDFTSILHPLVHLTKKGVYFNWDDPQ